MILAVAALFSSCTVGDHSTYTTIDGQEYDTVGASPTLINALHFRDSVITVIYSEKKAESASRSMRRDSMLADKIKYCRNMK